MQVTKHEPSTNSGRAFSVSSCRKMILDETMGEKK